MFRILQLHRNIRRFTSVCNNAARITTNQQHDRLYSSALAALTEEAIAPQTPSIQNVLLEIQNNLKDYGRISNKLVLNLTDCVSQTDRVNSTQALAAIRCFTDLSVDMKPENRIKHVNALWQRLEKLCVHLEVGHYNALLRAYLDSEHDFNPADFLAKMAENGVGPNRITYQFLVERYCQTGDVDGASRIMRFMEEKEVPITQNILNLMIMGHARNNDMESAKDVLNVMKSKGLSPDESTYGLLLSEYARKGDIESIVKFFKNEENRDIFLDSRTVANIIFQLASNGHETSIQKVLRSAPAMIRTEFHRLVHRLVSSGHYEACFPLLEEAQRYPERFLSRLGAFVVGQYASKAKSADEILKIISVLPKSDPAPLYLVALKNLLAQGEVDGALELVSAMNKEGVEMRTHMYFPLVARLAKSNNIKELANVIVGMQGKISRADIYVLYRILKSAGWQTQPAIDALLPLRSYGTIVMDCLVSALYQRHPNEAKELASQPLRTVVGATIALTSPGVLRRFPENAYVDVAVDIISRGVWIAEASDEDEGADSTSADSAPTESVSEDGEGVSEDGEGVAGERDAAVIPFTKLQAMSPQELADLIVGCVTRKLYSTDRAISILNEFNTRGIGITKETADELIQNCSSDKLKEVLQTLASTKLTFPGKNFISAKIEARSDIIDEYLKNDQLKTSYLKNLLFNKLVIALCAENNSRAVEVVKELGDDILPSALIAFIRYACNSNDTSLGLECWAKYSKKRGTSMYFVQLAVNLIKEGKIDDAINILTEKKVFIASKPYFKEVQNLLVVLNTNTDERCQNVLKDLLSEGTDRSLYIGHLNLLIESNQLVEAVDLFENSISKFGRYGLRNLGVALVEKEKYELLQRVQNILTATLGEEESLYELSLVLLKCRKVRQAKRIVELSGQPYRTIARVLTESDLASMESLAEVLPAFHPRREELCEKLLEVYDKKNDAENALALYTRFEEEKFIPSNKFLVNLKNLLQRCGYEVPFNTSALTEEQPSRRLKQSQNTPIQKDAAKKAPSKVSTDNPADIESAVLAALDKDREAFKKALSKLEAQRKHAFIDDLLKEAIRQKDFDRLAFVVPDQKQLRFDIFRRLLNDDSIRENYVEIMDAHIDDMADLLKAYWFDLFLKGEDKVCEDLWLKHSLYSMVYTPKSRSETLQGHEERYYAFFEKINAPMESRKGAFVGLMKKKIVENVEASVEFLEKEAKMISHINGPTLEKLRTWLVKYKASEVALAKFDALVKTHGINVNQVST